MVFVSATRLRVRSIIYLPAFFLANEASLKSLKNTKGFIAGKELVDRHLVFWTLTAWDDEAAMKSFRNAVAHRKAMQKLPVWCNEGAYLHWVQETADLPPWQIIHEKMVVEGKITKVRHPSPAHATKNYPPVRWFKTGRNF